MQAHDQYQAAKAEEALRPGACGREKLLKEPPFLHEQDPAHGRDIRRRHKRDHEDDVQPAVLFQLCTGQQVSRWHGNDRGAQYHAYTQQQGIADGLHILGTCDGLPRLIQVKAAICDDRLGKNCNQRAENEACQKHQQQRLR